MGNCRGSQHWTNASPFMHTMQNVLARRPAMILNDCVSLQVLCLFFWHTFGSIVFLDIGWKAELLKFLLWMETTFPPPTVMTSGLSCARTISFWTFLTQTAENVGNLDFSTCLFYWFEIFQELEKGHGLVQKILALWGVEFSSVLGRYQFIRMLGLRGLQIQKSCDFCAAVSLAKGTVLNVVCMSMLELLQQHQFSTDWND